MKLLLLLLFIISCAEQPSEGGGGGSKSKTPILEFAGHNTKSSLNSIYLPISRLENITNVKTYKTSDCSDSPDIFAPSDLNSGLPVVLEPNDTRLLFLRLNNGACKGIGIYTNDTISPNLVSFNNSLVGTTIYGNNTNITFTIDNTQEADLHSLEFYSDAGASNVLGVVSATLAKNSLGYIALPDNTITSLYFRGVDEVGNKTSAIYGPINYDIDSNIPTITNVNYQFEDITTQTSFDVSGTTSPDTTSIQINLNGVTVGTYTPASFNSGETLNLLTDSINTIEIIASDIHGNESIITTKTIRHVTSPTYNYVFDKLSNERINVIKDVGFERSINFQNISEETTTNTSIGSGTVNNPLMPGISVDLSNCQDIEALDNCSVTLSGSLSSEGDQTLTLSIDISGQTNTFNIDFNVSPIISETTLSSDLNTNTVTKIHKINEQEEVVLTSEGIYTLSDESFISKTLSNIERASRSVFTEGNLYVGYNGADLEITHLDSQVIFDYDAGFSILEIEVIKQDDYIIVTLIGTSNRRVVVIDITNGSLSTSVDYTNLSNIVKENNQVVFIGDSQIVEHDSGALIATPTGESHSDNYLYYNSGFKFSLDDSLQVRECVYINSTSCGIDEIFSLKGDKNVRVVEKDDGGGGQEFNVLSNYNNDSLVTTSFNPSIKSSYIEDVLSLSYYDSNTSESVSIYNDSEGTSIYRLSNSSNDKYVAIKGKLFLTRCLENDGCVTENLETNTVETSGITNIVVLYEDDSVLMFESNNDLYISGVYKDIILARDVSDLKGGESIHIYKHDYEYFLLYQKNDNSFFSGKFNLDDF